MKLADIQEGSAAQGGSGFKEVLVVKETYGSQAFWKGIQSDLEAVSQAVSAKISS